MRQKGCGPNPTGLVCLKEEEIPESSLSLQRHRERGLCDDTAQRGHLQARKREVTRHNPDGTWILKLWEDTFLLLGLPVCGTVSALAD